MSSADIKAGAAFVEVYVNNSRLIRGLKAAQKKLRGFEASVTAIGKKLMVASGLMSMPFVAGVKVFADFEQQMAMVSTMLDEPAKHIDRFKRGVREMSVEFGESTETLAKGLYDILSASVAPEKALDVLAVAAKSAKAGMTDTGTAADAITTMLNAYGMSADRAGEVSDLLFSIVKRGKTTFAELAPSIGLVATTAATAGVSTEELGAALATMTRNGVKTDNAITAVQAIISSFLKPAEEASEYARSLGFEMSVATLQAEGLEGIFKKISHLPPDAVAKLFPNVRAIRGVLPALQNMQGFTDDLAVMANKAGATDVAFEKMSKTLSATFASLKQASLAVLAAIGETLASDIAKAANAISKIIGKVHDFVVANKTLVATIAKIVLVVGGVGTTFLVLGMILKLVVISMSGFLGVISLFTGGVKLLAAIASVALVPIRLLGKSIGIVGSACGVLGKGAKLASTGGLTALATSAVASASGVGLLRAPLKLVTGALKAARASVLWFIAPLDQMIDEIARAVAGMAMLQTPLKQLGYAGAGTGTTLATVRTSIATINPATKKAAVGVLLLGTQTKLLGTASRKTGSFLRFLLSPLKLLGSLGGVLKLGLLLTPLKLLGTVAKKAGAILLSMVLRPIAMSAVVFKAFGAVIAGLFSPIGLLVAALATIGVVIVRSTGAGGKALAWLGEKFSALKEIAAQAWKGIGAALAKGDIALAGKILWLSLKLVFQAGINELMKLWINFKQSILSVWIELKASVQKLWQELWFALKEIAIKTGLAEPILKTFHVLESSWLKVTQFFARRWADLCSGIIQQWKYVNKAIKAGQEWVAKRVVDVMAFFDESIDADAAKKILEQQYNDEQKQLDQEIEGLQKKHLEDRAKLDEDQKQQQKDLDKKQADRLAELERQKAIGNKGRHEEKDQAQAAIDDAKARELEALDTQAKTDLDASAAELRKAREAWKAAIGEASAKDPAKGDKSGSYNLSSEAKYSDVKEKLQGAAPAIDKATNSVGTFSAQLAGRILGGNAAMRTAEAVEQLLEEQKRHNKRTEHGGNGIKFVAQGASSPLEA